MFARTLAALATVVAAVSMTFAVGCAPAADEPDALESDVVASDGALDVAFTVLDVRKADAEAGLTVLKSKQAYVAFFGTQPPSDVKFNQHWVLHHSLGVMGTGGYGTEVAAVERAGSGADRRLVVTTHDTAPGPMCSVTQALTNPQVAVRINKHNGAGVEHVSDLDLTDCSEPDFCHRVRCAQGHACDEAQDACVPASCDPANENDCGPTMVCMNQVRCITTPCPEDYRCVDPCGGITYDGTCNADASSVLWCDEGEILEYPCETGTRCDVDDDGWYDCL